MSAKDKRKSSPNSDPDPKNEGSNDKRQRQAAIEDARAVAIFRKSLKVSTDYLKSGKVLAWEVTPSDPIYADIQDFVLNGQVHAFGIRITNVLGIKSQADTTTAFHENPTYSGVERMMLSHGTRSDIVAAILENGFKCPALTNQMFGAGIYLADRLSKSALYCGAGCLQNTNYQTGSAKTARVGWIVLCDTLLGRIFHSSGAMNALTAAPNGYNSVKATGQTIPDPTKTKTINGCKWPLGPAIANTDRSSFTTTWGPTSFLQYNEYIVYEPWRIQPKFLLKVLITPNKQARKKK